MADGMAALCLPLAVVVVGIDMLALVVPVKRPVMRA
jgi:hypothetical protein